jgi:hypothetical protein
LRLAKYCSLSDDPDSASDLLKVAKLPYIDAIVSDK